MEFSRQKYWSGLPFPTPGDLANSGNELVSFVSPALWQVDSSPLSQWRSQALFSIPVHDSMIFFRGPWVYISPTRIPARCPAKEVLGEKEDLRECLPCCRLHTVFSKARGVSVSHSLQALVLHHIFHAEQHLTQSQGHHFLPYNKKKSTMNNKHNRFKRQSPPWPREVSWLLQGSRSVFVKTTHYTSSSFMSVALIRKYQWNPFPLN